MTEADYTIAVNTTLLRVAADALRGVIWAAEGVEYPEEYERDTREAHRLVATTYFSAMDLMARRDDD